MSPIARPAPLPVEGRRYVIQTPAKVNLCLKVIGRRPDGYHDLESLFCGIDLYDTLELTFGGTHVSLSCSNPALPTDRRNLALDAAHRFYQTLPAAVGAGLKIHIVKRIPAGAGLGGGSSNAAGVLYALNQIHGMPLSAGELRGLGAELGADVPFFLFGRPAWATGIGERLTAVDNLPVLNLLVVYPGVTVATGSIFKELNLGLTKSRKQHRKFPFKDRPFRLSRDLVNDLERVTFTRCPVVEEVKQALSELGAQGVLMSGSGSSVFGIFSDPQEVSKVAETIVLNRKWQTFSVKLLTESDYLSLAT